MAEFSHKLALWSQTRPLRAQFDPFELKTMRNCSTAALFCWQKLDCTGFCYDEALLACFEHFSIKKCTKCRPEVQSFILIARTALRLNFQPVINFFPSFLSSFSNVIAPRAKRAITLPVVRRHFRRLTSSTIRRESNLRSWECFHTLLGSLIALGNLRPTRFFH